jgi:hypothetical protein
MSMKTFTHMCESFRVVSSFVWNIISSFNVCVSTSRKCNSIIELYLCTATCFISRLYFGNRSIHTYICFPNPYSIHSRPVSFVGEQAEIVLFGWSLLRMYLIIYVLLLLYYYYGSDHPGHIVSELQPLMQQPISGNYPCCLVQHRPTLGNWCVDISGCVCRASCHISKYISSII